jgi:hypothetical protein
MTPFRTRPHPIAAFLLFMILGPYLLAALVVTAAVAGACYLIGAVVWVLTGKRIA